jgi:hypothetical protein
VTLIVLIAFPPVAAIYMCFYAGSLTHATYIWVL